MADYWQANSVAEKWGVKDAKDFFKSQTVEEAIRYVKEALELGEKLGYSSDLALHRKNLARLTALLAEMKAQGK